MVRSIPNPFIVHFFGCSRVSADIRLVKWAAAFPHTPSYEFGTTLWNTVCEAEVGLLYKNYWCVSESRIYVFGLCTKEGETRPQHFHPKTEGAHEASG